jgi:SRSO17 transposase
VGVFVAYVAPRGVALVAARLYLPKDWATDRSRRQAAYVPKEIVFQEKWQIGLDLLDQVRAALPGRWVAGDDEFGRCTELRAQLRYWKLRYVLDVPCNTLVRELSERRPPSRPDGKPRLPLFERVDHWVARQPKGRWRTVTIRAGEKGPLRVQVLLATVQTKDEDGRVGGQERLAVFRTLDAQAQVWYTLSNDRQADRGVLARVHGDRHRVEEVLEQGKQEVGLSHYEVRSWTGWHHHMTLSLLALWFLQLEKLRLGKKHPR